MQRHLRYLIMPIVPMIVLTVGCDRKPSKQEKPPIQSSAPTVGASSPAPPVNETTPLSDQAKNYVQEWPPFLKDHRIKHIRSLGKLLSEAKEFRHYVDQTEKYECIDLEFEGLFLSCQIEKNTYVPYLVKITSDRWVTQHNITVGSTAELVQTVLGAPSQVLQSGFIYQDEALSVEFKVNDSRVTEIEFAFCPE